MEREHSLRFLCIAEWMFGRRHVNGPSDLCDKDGNLYGTATGGGNSYGVVFALTPGVPGGLWSESPLYSFQGGLPTSGLVMDADGTLYGVAGGGTNAAGIVFKVAP